MQAVIVIPDMPVTSDPLSSTDLLMCKVAGIPLMVRVIATAGRTGATNFRLLCPGRINPAVWDTCAAHPALRGVKVEILPYFRIDRESGDRNAVLSNIVGEDCVWLPWNFITHSRNLRHLQCSPVPEARNAQSAALSEPNGVFVNSHADIARAERFLVANSGKPTDGFYSGINRRLCRPAVRWLTHTTVSPNQVTLSGLAVAAAAALIYSRGSYWNYVAGAFLFFLSGLIDEMDGMVARLKFRESAFGTWFEGFVDNATYLLLFGGIATGLYRQRGTQELIWGIALLVGCLMSAFTVALQRKMLTAPDRPHEYATRMKNLLTRDSSLVSRAAGQLQVFIKKGVSIHYVLIFSLVGLLPFFLRLAAVSANVTWILASYFSWKFTRKNRTATVRVCHPQLKEIK